MSRKTKIAAIVILAVLLSGTVFMFTRLASPKSKVETVTSPAEAARAVDPLSLLRVKEKYSKDYTLKAGEKTVDLIPPSADIEYILEKNGGKSRSFTMSLDVQDTTPPVIRVKKTEIVKNSKEDVYSLIEATDSLDGKIPKESITLSKVPDFSKKGKTKTKITAADKAGNTAEKTVEFTVRDKSEKSGVDADAVMEGAAGVWMKNCDSKAKLKERIIPGIDAEELGCMIISKKGGSYYINDFEMLGPADNKLTFISAAGNTATATVSNSEVGRQTVTFDTSRRSSKILVVTMRGKTFRCYHTGADTIGEYNRKYK